jgi:fatty-acyl-CoA synthase
MLPNTPEMVEAHYAVPALNAVLNTLNTGWTRRCWPGR